MRILIVGKHGSIVHWLEDMVDGFSDAGHDVRVFSVVGDDWLNYLHLKFYRTLDKRRVGGLLAGKLRRAVREFRPDLLFCVCAYWLPQEMLQAVRELPQRPAMVGWVGDRFEAKHRAIDALFDRIYYTDSAFFDLAREFGFGTSSGYLPLAVNPRLFRRGIMARSRSMVFVANRTGHREQAVRAVRRPLVLYGRGWKSLSDTRHEIHAERIPAESLSSLYSAHCAVLNVRNEVNVLHGLNQRSFEPYACATPVLNDDMADIPRCFEPGREILVYRDTDELNVLYERLADDPGFAAAVGEAGWRRVMAQHTYLQRVQTILQQTNLERRSV